MIIRIHRIALIVCGLAVVSCSSDEDTDGDGGIAPKLKWTVGVVGSGSGRVTSSSSDIDCLITNGSGSGKCSAQFNDKTTLTLTATPNADQLFKAWGGDCAGSTSCSLTLTKDVSVSAGFIGKEATLSLSYQSPTADDGAALITITGPSITAIAPAAGIQIARRARTSDGKTVILVRGNLTTGVLGSVTVGGLDADKVFTLTVEQVAARLNATDPTRSYIQRPSLAGYTASIK